MIQLDENLVKEEIKEQVQQILKGTNELWYLVEHESKIKSFFDALEKDEFTGKESLRDEDFETLMELLEDAFEDN